MKNGLQTIQLSCRQPREHRVAAIKTRQHQRYIYVLRSVICVGRDLRTLRIYLSAAKQFDTVLLDSNYTTHRVNEGREGRINECGALFSKPILNESIKTKHAHSCRPDAKTTVTACNSKANTSNIGLTCFTFTRNVCPSS